ncbi:MAG TPA: pilus assembly protein PilM [Vicinamibacterales bacterium]|nr:pilus assembly protein PilM [Vicinamibacterales bacterium]
MSPPSSPTAPRRSGRRPLFTSPPPSLALEIARDRVSGVTMDEAGGTVLSYSVEPLASGVVEPALNTPNVLDQAALSGTITTVLDRLAGRPRRLALVLPDTVAKVSLVRFEKVPAKASDLDQLIRWQVRKAAPFKIEDAQLSWVPALPAASGGREFVVTLARRDIIEKYEAACDAAGLHAGLVDIATFSLVNAALAASPIDGDWLLVHVSADYVTLAVVRGEDLVFFRNRSASEGDLADLVHQTAMYHEDRLGGGGFSRVTLTGASVYGTDHAERARRSLEERLGVRVEPLDFLPAAGLRDRIAVNPALLDALAPAVGVLLRERTGVRPRATAVA